MNINAKQITSLDKTRDSALSANLNALKAMTASPNAAKQQAAKLLQFIREKYQLAGSDEYMKETTARPLRRPIPVTTATAINPAREVTKRIGLARRQPNLFYQISKPRVSRESFMDHRSHTNDIRHVYLFIAIDIDILFLELVRRLTRDIVYHLHDVGTIHHAVTIGIARTCALVFEENETAITGIASLIKLELGSIDNLTGILVEQQCYNTEFHLVLDTGIGRDINGVFVLHCLVFDNGRRQTALNTTEWLVGRNRNIIVCQIAKLIESCGRGDFIYLHFSGHGQPFEDLNGDEDDGWDESIIPYDAQQVYEKGKYEGASHIIDDELHSYFQKLMSKVGSSGLVCVVIDACHAGNTYMGDEEDEGEAFLRGSKKGFSPNAKDYHPRINAKGRFQVLKKADQGDVIVLEACRSYQSNYEIKQNGKYYGPLSYYVGMVLAKQNLTATHYLRQYC